MAWAKSRKYPRKRVYFPVEFFLGGATHRAHAWTLGGGGLFIGTEQEIEPGTELALRFCPAAPLPTIEAKAVVRHRIPNEGLGVEFTEINPEHRRMIMLLVGHRLAEQTRFPRAALRVQVGHDGDELFGISRNISAAGMFIETRKVIALDPDLKLRFDLNDGGPPMSVSCQIRYLLPSSGLGVEFVDLSPGDRQRIKAYVARDESRKT